MLVLFFELYIIILYTYNYLIKIKVFLIGTHMKKAIVLGIFSVIMSTLHGASDSGSMMQENKGPRLSPFINELHKELIKDDFVHARRIFSDRPVWPGLKLKYKPQEEFISRAVVQDYIKVMNEGANLICDSYPEIPQAIALLSCSGLFCFEKQMMMEEFLPVSMGSLNERLQQWSDFHKKIRSVLNRLIEGKCSFEFKFEETDKATMEQASTWRRAVRFEDLSREERSRPIKSSYLAASIIITAHMLQDHFKIDSESFLAQPRIKRVLTRENSGELRTMLQNELSGSSSFAV